MKSPGAPAYYEVRNVSCRLQQDVDLRDAAAIAAREKSRAAKRRRPAGCIQGTVAWEMTYLTQHSANDCFRTPKARDLTARGCVAATQDTETRCAEGVQ